MHLGKSTSRRAAIEGIGWCGTGAIMLAYALVSFDVIDSTGVAYQLLNLTGAIGIIILAAARRVTQTVVLNIFWALIALAALVTILS